MKHEHEEIYFIDFYAYTSNLKNWNSTFKVIVSFVTLLICILANKNQVSITVFISMSAFIVLKGRLKLKHYLKLLLIPLIFIIMGTIAIAIEFSSHPIRNQINIPLFNFYFILSRQNIDTALRVFLKSLGAVCAMYTMILSTTANEIIMVLNKLHIPNIIIQLMNMIYRFIFILFEAQRQMECSAKSRLGYCDFKTFCCSFGHIAKNLLLVSLKKANAYYDSMISRLYNGYMYFLEENKKVTVMQILGVCIYWFVLIVIYLI